ncbi:MAG: helix-turn-helix domain-containing protein [Reichenbachiella sp.]|uniref:winged helix-turn-helix transcriptional regulator n=1 Tax=Reichenbachiella sp. TaxID=2184521 RepID=UPI003267839B
MSTYERKIPLKCDCPLERTLNAISGKWKPALISELLRGTVRLRDLEKMNDEASKRTLAQQLGELVEDGLVERKDYHEYPKRVEYSMTLLGKELAEVVNILSDFGEKLENV